MSTTIRIGGLVGALAILCVGCGSPPPERFAFTPEPFTIIEEQGTPLAVGVENDTGARYFADRLAVQVEHERVPEFIQWAKSVGFEARVLIDIDYRETTLLLVTVPVGSVPDAAQFIAEQEGVVLVERDYLAELFGETDGQMKAFEELFAAFA